VRKLVYLASVQDDLLEIMTYIPQFNFDVDLTRNPGVSAI